MSTIRGVDASGWDFVASTDQTDTLRDDLERIASCELLAPGAVVGGFVFNVHSGELVAVDYAKRDG